MSILIGEEIFEKESWHLKSFDNDDNDKDITISCNCWFDDVYRIYQDLKDKEKAEAIRAKLQDWKYQPNLLPHPIRYLELSGISNEYRSVYANNCGILGDIGKNDKKTLDLMNKIIDDDILISDPILLKDAPNKKNKSRQHIVLLSKKHENRINELSEVFSKLYPGLKTIQAYNRAKHMMGKELRKQELRKSRIS